MIPLASSLRAATNQDVQSFTPGQLTPYRYIQEVYDHPDTS